MSSAGNTNFMQAYGKPLHDHGFPIIPIRPESKAPSIKSWQTIESNCELVRRWISAPGQGVGVKTGRFCGVDIDCKDPAIVDSLVNYCMFEFGLCPVRYGDKPKTLLVYRSDVSDRPKSVSATFAAASYPKGYRVEALGLGQQFVAYGIHPDTLSDYVWEGSPLHEWQISAIPIIDSANIKAIFSEFERLARAAGYDTEGAQKLANTSDFSGGVLASIKPPTDLSDEHIALVLANLPVTDTTTYDDWVRVGMSLHHQYEGDRKGLALWHTWSKQSPHYKKDDLEAKWPTFDDERESGNVVTFRSLIDETGVKIHGDDPLADTLENYIYIGEGDVVADTRQLPHNAIRKLSEFKNLLANVRIKTPALTPTGKPTTKKVPVAQLWLMDPLRKTAVQKAYAPGNDRLYSAEGQSYYNTFAFPNHLAVTSSDRIKPFLDHVDYLFPNPAERQWFLQWLAHVAQRPSERPQVSPLHIARQHGAGRGLLTKTIARLFGQWNCKKTSASALIDGDYNEYLYESLFVFLDEAKGDGNRRFEVSDKTRDTLAEDVLPINVKWGFKGTTNVYSRIFLMSNHFDAYRIPPQDRRLNVFEGPEVIKGLDYFTRYGAWLADDTAIAELFNWLKRYELRGWNFQRSMDTAARQRMIDYGRNHSEAAFFELLANPPREIMTHAEVVEALEKSGDGDLMDEGISEKQITKLLQEECTRYSRRRINGKRVYPWNLNPKNNHSDAEIKRIMEGPKPPATVSPLF